MLKERAAESSDATAADCSRIILYRRPPPGIICIRAFNTHFYFIFFSSIFSTKKKKNHHDRLQITAIVSNRKTVTRRARFLKFRYVVQHDVLQSFVDSIFVRYLQFIETNIVHDTPGAVWKLENYYFN